MIKIRFWNAKHILLCWVLTGQISLQVLLNVFREFGQNLTSEHISATLNLDLLLILQILETGVSIAPALPIEVEDFDLAIRVVVDHLGVLFAAHSELFFGDLNFIFVLEVLINSRKSVHYFLNYLSVMRVQLRNKILTR